MRITGGELKGRILRVPDAGMRPTQERVREALYSSLAARVPGARVLDLFAGSGAVGLEAWSRGASEVHWVEENRRTFRVLQRNVETLCSKEMSRRACHAVDALRYLDHSRANGQDRFDLVFADPPYAVKGMEKTLEKTLHALQAGSILAGDGLLIYEQSKKEPVCEASGWDLWKDKVYGSTRLLMYAPCHKADPEESM